MDKEPQSNKVILSGGKRKVSEADLNLNQVGFYHQDPILSTLLSMRKHINSMTPEVEVQSINPLIDVRNIDSDVVIMSNLRGYNKVRFCFPIVFNMSGGLDVSCILLFVFCM